MTQRKGVPPKDKNGYQWNASDYAKHSSAQLEWAKELIQKLHLKGGDHVLDIGSGDGKITAEIACRVPMGNVTGIDSSEAMIRLASQAFPSDRYTNLYFKKLDVREMDFTNRFDVVFSNAVLHWVLDHLSILKNIKKSLKPKGRILLQMGGKGNAGGILTVMEGLILDDTWKRYFQNFAFPYGFYGPVEYKSWLKLSGLQAMRIDLIPKDMKQMGREGLAGWIRTTWLPYIERIPQTLREAFIAELVELYVSQHPPDADGYVHVDMMRLEIEAVHAEG